MSHPSIPRHLRMSEKFDPYRKWLGIPPAEQPPDHYRLLGIAPFEDDLDVIAYAADRQMSHVRKFQTGANGADAQKLLSELATARRCLLAADQRKSYDQQLRKKVGGNGSGGVSPVAAPQPGARQKPVLAPVPPPTDAPVQPKRSEPPPPPSPEVPKAQPIAAKTNDEPSLAVRSRPVASTARRSRRKKSSAMPMIGALVALAGMACLILVVAIAVTNSDVDGEPSPGGNSVGVQNTSMQQSPTVLPKPTEDDDDPKPRGRRPRPRPPKDRERDRDPVMPADGITGTEDDDGEQGGNVVPVVPVDDSKTQDESEPSPLPLPTPSEGESSSGGNRTNPGELEFDPADVPDVPESFPDPDGELPKPGGVDEADEEAADADADDEP